MTATPSLAREQLIEKEIERLHRELDILQGQWNKKHWLGLFVLAAIPVYLFAPAVWALVVVLATPCLIATQAYLIGMRRAECRELILHCERDLDGLRERRAA